jgi:hypothetical protein
MDIVGNITANDSNGTNSTNTTDISQSGLNLGLKITFLFILLGITALFALMPLFCKVCKNSTWFLGLANSFSGGIFIGIALFHLLPEVFKLLLGFF